MGRRRLGAGAVGRRAAGLDLPGAQRRELRRLARLRRRRRHHRHPAPSTTSSTPIRRRTSRCRSPIRRSRPWSSTRCTCCRSGCCRSLWTVGIIAALYGVVRISQRLLPARASTIARRCAGPRSASGSSRCAARFDYGQINVAARAGCACTRCTAPGGGSRACSSGWRRGSSSPRPSAGLYFFGVRRWGTALFAAVVFVGTVGSRLLVLGGQARYYFTDLIGDARRVGSIATSHNQSWRGGISRILGHDAGYSAPVIIAIAVDRGAGVAGLAGDRRGHADGRTASAGSSWCNCSACCCRRSRGRITGCG